MESLLITLVAVAGIAVMLSGASMMLYASSAKTKPIAKTVKRREGLIEDKSDEDNYWERYKAFWWNAVTDAGYSPTAGERMPYIVIGIGFAVFLSIWAILSLPILALFVAFAPGFGIFVVLGNKARSRSVLLESQLGGFLGSVGVGVESGQQPVTAVLNAIKETREPLRKDLSYLAASLENNVPAKEAFGHLRRLTPNPYLKELCGNMMLALADGSDISKSIEVLGKNVRANAKMRGDIKSKTSESRIGSVILLFAVPMGLGLSGTVPNPQEIWSSPLGMLIMAIALGLGIFAARFANKMAKKLESI